MNKSLCRILLVGGVSILALTGCQEGLLEKRSGREVRFTVSSVGTKTAYSGVESGGYERIDWVDGDKILIWGDKAQVRESDPIVRNAVYDIDPSTISGSGRVSKAKLTPRETGGLVFSEVEGPYRFAAVYPAEGYLTSQTTDGIIQSITPTIPSSQTITDGYPDMQKAILLGDPVSISEDETVSLSFRPYYNLFQFSVCAEKAMTITRIDLISTSKENNGTTFGPSPLCGKYSLSCNLNEGWSVDVPAAGTENTAISAVLASPISLTMEEGATTTNTAKIALMTVPADITGVTVVFYVTTDDGEQTRTLNVSYAKDDVNGTYHRGDPVKFAKLNKHNIEGIILPANMSKDVVIDLQVIPWEDAEGSVTYGPGQPVVSAIALEYASGAAINEGEERRLNNNFANATDPIKAYFYVFSPTDATWKIKIAGATDKFTVTSANATSTSAKELSGAVNGNTTNPGRVDFTIARNGATATDKIQLTFSLMLGDREISIDSEIIRGKELTITGKVGQ